MAHSKICGHCHRPLPCDCRALTSSPLRKQRPSHKLCRSLSPPELCKGIQSTDIFEQFFPRNFCKNLKFDLCAHFEPAPCPCPEDINKRIEENVLEWLKDIPVYASYSNQDKYKRDEAIDKLIGTLKKIYGKENFKERAKAAILECLSALPMWYPGGQQYRETFKNEITAKLLLRIKYINRRRDKFSEVVAQWIFTLHFKPLDDKGDPIDKDKIIKDVTQELRTIALRKHMDKDYREALIGATFDILDRMPIIIEGNKYREYNQLAIKLTDKLMVIPRRELAMRLDYTPQGEFEPQVLAWLEAIPEFNEVGEIEAQLAIKKFAVKLEELHRQGVPVEEMEAQMQEAINDWLETIISRIKLDLKAHFQKEITDWLDDIPELVDVADKADMERFSDKLADDLNKLQLQGVENEYIQEQMLEAIRDQLGVVLDQTGERVDIKYKTDLSETLLENIIATVQRAEKKVKLPKLYKKKIDKWLENIPELTCTNPAEKMEHDNFVDTLCQKLLELQNKGVTEKDVQDEMLEEIKAKMDGALENKNVHINSELKEKSYKNLLEKLIKASKRVDKPVPIKELEDEIEKQVKDWFDDIPEIVKGTPAEQKEIEKLEQNLVRNLIKLQAEGVEDEDVQKEMFGEIKGHLETALHKTAQPVDAKTKSDLADFLLDEIVNTVERAEKILELPEVFQTKISEWLENINELSSDNLADKKENDKLSQILAKKLHSLQLRGVDNRLVRNLMLEEIKGRMDVLLENKNEIMSPKVKTKLAENLLDKIIKAIKKAEKCLKPSIVVEKKFQRQIYDWLDEIPQLTSRNQPDKKEIERFTENLAKNLTKLQAEGIEEEEVQEKMLEQIKEQLDTALEKRGTRMDVKDKKELSENLLDRLFDAVGEFEMKRKLPNLIQKEINNFLEDTPELKSVTLIERKENEKLSQTLAPQLLNLQAKGIYDKDIRNKMLDVIKNQLEATLEKKSESLSSKARNKIYENLLDKIIRSVQKAEKGLIPNVAIEKEFVKEIADWLEEVPNLNSTTPSEKKENEKISQTMAKNLAKIQADGIEEDDVQELMLEEIKDQLDAALDRKTIHIDIKDKKELADTLLDNLVDTVGEVEKRRQLPKVIKKEIFNYLEDIPEMKSTSSPEKRDNEKLSQVLAKRLHDWQSKGKDVRELMLEDIKGRLIPALDRRNQKKLLSPKAKNKLSENLLERVLRAIKNAEKSFMPRKVVQKEFQQEIEDWLEDIPELTSTSAFEKKENETFSYNLAKILNRLQSQGIEDEKTQDQMFDETKEQLDLALDKKGEHVDDNEKKELVETLLDKLFDLVEKAERKRKIPKAIHKEILNFFDEVPELKSTTPTEKRDTDNISHLLAKKIYDLQSRGIDDKDLRELMMTEIKMRIEAVLEKKGESMSPKVKVKLAEALLEKVARAIKKAEKGLMLGKVVEKEFYREISDWLEDIPEIKSVNPTEKKDNDKISQSLAKTLNKLQVQGIDEEKIQDQMLEEIRNQMDAALDKKGERVDAKVKKDLAEHLLDKLVDSVVAVEKKRRFPKIIQKEILRFLEDNVELKSSTPSGKKSNEKLSQTLAKKLYNMLSKGIDDKELRSQMVEEIKSKIAVNLEKKEESVNLKTEHKLAENLLTKVLKAIKKAEISLLPSKLVEREFIQEITDWIEDIPQLKSVNTAEKKDSEKIIQAFAKTLTKLQPEGIEEEKVRDKMVEAIKTQMDAILDKKGERIDAKDKIEMVNKLIDNLVDAVEKAEKRRNLPKVIQKEISVFIEEIPELKSSIPSEKKENDKISLTLSKKLNDLQSKGMEDKNVQDQMLDEIIGQFDYILDKRGETINPKYKNKMAENLLDKVIRSLIKAEKNIVPSKKMERDFQHEISDWLEDIPELSSGSTSDKRENDKCSRNLAKVLIELQFEGMEEEDVQDQILEEIKDHLDTALDNKGERIATKDKTELADNLLDKLVDCYEKAEKKQQLPEMIQRELINFFEGIPALKSTTLAEKKEDEKVIHCLAKKLHDLQLKGIDDKEIRDQMMDEIKIRMDSVLEKKVEPVNIKTKHILAENLLDKVIKLIKKTGKGIIPRKAVEKEFFKEIFHWIEDVPELLSDNPIEKKENEKLSLKMAKDLTKLQMGGIDEEDVQTKMLGYIQEEMFQALEKKGDELNDTEIKTYATHLLENLLIAVAKVVKMSKLPKLFERKIFNWFEDNPEVASRNHSERKQIEKMCQELAKKIRILQAKGVDDRLLQDSMLDEIKDKIDIVLRMKNETISSKGKNKLAETLVDSLMKTMKRAELTQIPSKSAEEELVDIIANWVEDIPELSDTSPIENNEKISNEKFIHSLAKKLNRLQCEGVEDEDVQEDMLHEIKDELDDALENIGKYIDRKTKIELSDKLLDEMANSVARVEKIRELPLIFHKDVFNWMEDVPELASENSTEKAENENLSKMLAGKLYQIHLSDIEDEELQEVMVEEIKSHLETFLQMKGEVMSPKAMTKLAEVLFEMLEISVKKALNYQAPKKEVENEFKANLTNWLGEIPQLANVDKKSREKYMSKLARDLNKLQAEGIQTEEVQEQMLDEIKEALDYILLKKGERIDSKEKINWTENVLDTLVDSVEKLEKKRQLPKIFQREILNWMEEIPELNADTNMAEQKHNDRISQSLARKLYSMQGKGIDDDDIRSQMLEEIKHWLEMAVQRKGEHLNPKAKRILADNLLRNLVDIVKLMEGQGGLLSKEFEDELKKEITKFLDDIPVLTDRLDNKDTSMRLAKNLNKLQSDDLAPQETRELMLTEIKEELEAAYQKKREALSKKDKDTLAASMYEKVMDAIERAENKLKLPKVFQKKILRWLDGIPQLRGATPSQKKENDNMSITLAKMLFDIQSKGPHSEDTFTRMLDEIKDQLDIAFDKKGDHLIQAHKNVLAQNLLTKLVKLIKRADKPSDERSKQLQNDLLDIVAKWFNEIPPFASCAPKDKQEINIIAQKLAKDLNQLQSEGINDEDVRNEISEDIKEALDFALESIGEHLDLKCKNKLVENLIGQVVRTSKKSYKIRRLPRVFNKDVSNWIEEIVELKSETLAQKKENDKLGQGLSKKLFELQSAPDRNEETIQKLLQDEIRGQLDLALDRRGQQLNPKAKNQLAENLAVKLLKSVKKAEEPTDIVSDDESETEEEHERHKEVMSWLGDIPGFTSSSNASKKDSSKSSQQIWSWFNEIPELAGGSKADNQRLVDKLNTKLLKIRSKDIDEEAMKRELRREIDCWLGDATAKKGTKIDPKSKELLVNKLLRNMKKLKSKGRKSSADQSNVPSLITWKSYVSPELSKDTPRLSLQPTKPMTKNKVTDVNDLRQLILESESAPRIRYPYNYFYERSPHRRNTSENAGSEEARQLLDNITNIINIPNEDFTERKVSTSTQRPLKRLEKILQSPEETPFSSPRRSQERQNKRKKSSHFRDPEIYYVEDPSDNTRTGKRKSESATQYPTKTRSKSIGQEAEDEEVKEVSKDLNIKAQNKITALIAKNIDRITSQGQYDDLKDQIVDILTREVGLPDEEAEPLSMTILKKARAKLKVTLSNMSPTSSSDINLKELIRQEVEQTLDEFGIAEFTKFEVEPLLTDVLYKNIKHSGSATVTKEDLVKVLKEADLPSDQIEQISDKLLASSKKLTSPDQALKNAAQKTIDDFVDELAKNMSPEDAKLLRQALGQNVEKVAAILADPNLTPEQKRELMKEELMKQMTLLPIELDKSPEELAKMLMGKLESNINFHTSSPRTSIDRKMQLRASNKKQAIENSAQKTIDDFVDELAKDMSPEDAELLRQALGKNVDKLASILANPNLTPEQKRELMKEELMKQMESLPIELNKSPEELANMLMGKLERNISLQTSTPRNSVDRQMQLRKTSNGEQYKKNEQQYTNQVISAIDTWANKLSINPKILEDAGFKDTLIKDLAGDIVDRQKYLQLNPDAKTSEAEELDQMQYQTSRWLNKFLDPKDVETVMDKVPDLIKGLQRISIPQLVRPAGRRRESILAQGGIPTYKDALQDEISMWLGQLPPGLYDPGNPEQVQQMQGLADKIAALRGMPDAEERIQKELDKWLPLMFPNATKEELAQMAEALKGNLKNKGFTDDSWMPTQNTSQFMEENANSAIGNWLKTVPFYLNKSPQEKLELEKNIPKFSNSLKKVYDNALVTGADPDVALKNDMIKHLKDIVMDPELRADETFLRGAAESLLDSLKQQNVFPNNSSIGPAMTRDYLTECVNNWMQSVPVPPTPEEQRKVDQAKNNLINKIRQIRQLDPSSSKHDAILKDEIKKFLQSNVTDPAKRNNEQFLTDKSNELVRQLRATPIDNTKDNTLFMKESQMKKFKTPAEILYDDVEKWCEDLPIHLGDSSEEQERVQTYKQNLASRIINKTAEMNMNPEIFSDDFLYEDILKDELDMMLDEIPPNPELAKYSPALKKHLISKIMDARKKMREELEGKAYKQQLKDVVSSSMHLPEYLTIDERASFEVLKDNVADAYVNLNYVTDNEDEKNKYKRRIADEVNKFCGDFMRRHPSSPINPHKINCELYSALQKVPVPKDESMRSEVEQLRIKDTIGEWTNELPIRQEAPAERLQRHKMSALLARRLHEIEKEKESNPIYDADSKMMEEITKYLKKIPLLPGEEANTPDYARKLIERLKNSEQSRKFNMSRRTASTFSQTGDSTTPSYPPCMLSEEDQAHLKRIKERVCARNRCPTIPQTPCYRDTGVSPSGVETGSQTDVRPPCSTPRVCPRMRRDQAAHTCPRQDAACNTPQTQSPHEISPRVIVKEYVWDSPESLRASGFQIRPPCFPGYMPYMPQPQGPNVQQPSYQGGITAQPSPYDEQGTNGLQFKASELAGPSSQAAAKASPRHSVESPKTCMCRDMSADEYQSRRKPCRSPSSSNDEGSGRPYRKPRVTKLGSLDNASCPRKETKANNTRTCRDYDSSWTSIRFPDDDCFHTGRSRHHFCTEEPYSRRERKRETSRCKCKERIVTACKGRNKVFEDTCQSCGTRCPHPSYLYFK